MNGLPRPKLLELPEIEKTMFFVYQGSNLMSRD